VHLIEQCLRRDRPAEEAAQQLRGLELFPAHQQLL